MGLRHPVPAGGLVGHHWLLDLGTVGLHGLLGAGEAGLEETRRSEGRTDSVGKPELVIASVIGIRALAALERGVELDFFLLLLSGPG